MSELFKAHKTHPARKAVFAAAWWHYFLTIILLFGSITFVITDTFATCIQGDCFSGYGSKTYASGSQYDGEWHAGYHEGHGIKKYPAGSYYEGDWLTGKKHGPGKLTLPDGQVWQQIWNHGTLTDQQLVKPDNQSRHSSANASIAPPLMKGKKFAVTPQKPAPVASTTPKAKVKSKAKLKENPLSGFAVKTDQDGNHYKGNWQNGKKNGHGVLIYKDGRKYDGAFKNNVFHGTGTYTFSDGGKMSGRWANGRYIGK